MPARSAKQYNMMQAIAHGAFTGGPSKEVAREFIEKTPHETRSRFAKMVGRKKKSSSKMMM